MALENFACPWSLKGNMLSSIRSSFYLLSIWFSRFLRQLFLYSNATVELSKAEILKIKFQEGSNTHLCVFFVNWKKMGLHFIFVIYLIDVNKVILPYSWLYYVNPAGMISFSESILTFCFLISIVVGSMCVCFSKAKMV